jgi:hypothetical protein
MLDLCYSVSHYSPYHSVSTVLHITENGRNENVRQTKTHLFACVHVLNFDSITVPLVSKSEERQASASNANDGGSSGSRPSTDPRPPQNQAEETRYQQVIDYLVHVGVTSRAILEGDFESPQYKAANWIANVDEYQIPLPTELGVDTPLHTRFTERYALAAIYYALGGDAWRFSMKFMEPTDHCEWYQDFVTRTGNVLRLGVSECKALGSGLEDKLVRGVQLRT